MTAIFSPTSVSRDRESRPFFSRDFTRPRDQDCFLIYIYLFLKVATWNTKGVFYYNEMIICSQWLSILIKLKWAQSPLMKRVGFELFVIIAKTQIEAWKSVKNKNIGLTSVSWVSQNIWRDWNQENGPETRPVSWSRISAAGTSTYIVLAYMWWPIFLKMKRERSAQIHTST